ncbi:urease accessory protein UreD [Marinomonas sp. IMCC 4694]|uniref:urease accessory protein UreD n=1 Tax=Marinomonas sp. IMCC 4694 TaxID=2605432 RepID=UPI0011E66272|nr:urease accessory protein UreD [Marinomonas sp. IMCC 4694]TYL46983.1 urease accessory protein UreD [Marinomonas sp. IMCC 4694]
MNNKTTIDLAETPSLPPLLLAETPASQWHAFLTLGFCKTSRGTVLKTCDHQGPLYVQKPFYPEGRDTAHVYLLHPPGGLVSGDRLTITANLAENTHVLITTPGAGRVYRAREDKTLQHQVVQLNVAKNSAMEWLPQETILYPNAHTRLENRIDLAENAQFIGWEITCFGLPANHQDFGEGHAEQGFEIRQNGRIKVRERLVIDNNSRAVLGAKAGLDGHSINGVLIAGPFAATTNSSLNHDDLISALRGYCQQHSQNYGSLSGVSLVGDYLIVRSLHRDSEQMKQLFIQCWQAIRPAFIHKEARVPRIWLT